MGTAEGSGLQEGSKRATLGERVKGVECHLVRVFWRRLFVVAAAGAGAGGGFPAGRARCGRGGRGPGRCGVGVCAAGAGWGPSSGRVAEPRASAGVGRGWRRFLGAAGNNYRRR